MPRIPRAEARNSYQVADMPHLVGEGWTAPGRATQQLGQSIGQLGKAVAGLGQEVDQQAEAEELHKAKIEALNMKNAWDLDEIQSQATYTGDGTDYAPTRQAQWAEKAGEYSSKYANARPKVRRFAETFVATATGGVAEGAAKFGRTRWEGNLFSETDAAVTGQFSQMLTPEAADRYKGDPSLFEQDLRLKIEEANRIIDALPLKDGRQDALRKKAAGEIERIITSYPPSYSINSIRSKIEEFSRPQVPGAVPGPQGALPDGGPVRFLDPPLQRTVGRPRSAPVQGVVLHQTWGSDTMEGNGSWSNQKGTGANYYIDKEGAIYRWAPDDVSMGHIGKGRDHPNNRRPDFTNDNTIGIEIMTRPNERPNEKQIAAARALTLELAQKYKLDPTKDVFGHGELTNPSHRRSDEAIEAVQAIRTGRIAQVPRETSSGGQAVSPNGIAFIKEVEGEKLKAYADGRQVSIGYGSRAKSPDEVITKAEAEKRLDTELRQANAAIDKSVTVPLNQNQRDALVSYVYNAGPNGAARGVFDALNKGDVARATQLMMADDKGGVVAGRRQKEVALFNKPDVSGRAFTQVAGLQARQADDGPARVYFDADRNYTKTEIDNIIKKHGPNVVIGGNPQNEGYKEAMTYAREKGAKVHAYYAGPGEPEFGYNGDGKVQFPQDHEEIKKRGFAVSDWQKGGKWLGWHRDQILEAKKEGAEPYSVEWDNINDKKPGEIRDLLADQTKWSKENGVATRIVLKNLNARQWQAVNQGIADGKIDRAIIAPFAIAEESMSEGDAKAAAAEAQRQGVSQFRTENTFRYASPADGFERQTNRIPTAEHIQAQGRGQVQPGVLRPSVESFLVEGLSKKLPALQQAYKGQVVSTVKAVEDAAAKGTLPSEQEQARISKMIADLGDKDVAAMYENAVITGQINQQYKSLPPSVIKNDVLRQRMLLAQQGAAIVPKRGVPGADEAQEDGGGLDPVRALTIKKVEALDKLHDRMVAELKKDPRSWAAEAGVIIKTPEISKDNFGPEILAARAEETDAIANHYGEEFRQYFSPEERERLKERFARGGKELVADMGMMVEAFGPKAISALKEVSKDAPAAAHLGWMIVNKADNQAVKDLADAIALHRTDGFKPIAPHANDARLNATSVLGRTMAAMPQAEQRAIDVANLLYEVRARRKQIDPKAPDWSLWKEGLSVALGENTDTSTNIKYGGLAAKPGWFSSAPNVVLPPNVRQDALPELLEAIRISDIAPGGVPRTEAKPATAGANERAVRAAQQTIEPSVPQPDSPTRIADANRMLGYGNQAALDRIATQGAPIDAKGRPLKLATLAKANLVTIGPGRYWLAIGDPTGTDPQWVGSSNTDDGRFVLDLTALEPLLRQRVPSAYRPY